MAQTIDTLTAEEWDSLTPEQYAFSHMLWHTDGVSHLPATRIAILRAIIAYDAARTGIISDLQTTCKQLLERVAPSIITSAESGIAFAKDFSEKLRHPDK